MTGTFRSHILNMFHGVTAGWTYELDILYAHFPMQVSVNQSSVIIDNFLGERHPRKTKIHGETTVSIDGEKVLVTGPDIEAVGQTAGSIEQLTTIKDKDNEITSNSNNENEKDELYFKALEIIKVEKKASTSFLQRKLQIGYNRAARIMEMMEKEGVVGQANHVGKREIL